jgi:hypothetical protein
MVRLLTERKENKEEPEIMVLVEQEAVKIVPELITPKVAEAEAVDTVVMQEDMEEGQEAVEEELQQEAVQELLGK